MGTSICIPTQHSYNRIGSGQLRRLHFVTVAVAVVVLLALGLGLTGCTSTYHEACSQMPPEPEAEFQVCLEQAAQAEQHTTQAATWLLASLQRAEARLRIQTDFDRLEAAGFDLERRLLAARDAAARTVQPSAHAAELERLGHCAASWLDYAKRYRTADSASQLRELQLLRQALGLLP